MAGLISGFLDGVGKATAESGRMMLADQIAKEREEVNFLRDKEITKGKQDFTTSERISSQEFTARQDEKKQKNDKSIADKKSSSKTAKDNRTVKSKNIDDLIRRNVSEEDAILKVYPKSKIDYTDKEGNRVVVIPDGPGKSREIGRFKTGSDGQPKWFNIGEQTENAKVTKMNRKSAKDKASDKAGIFSLDTTDFPSTGGDRGEWTKKEAQRIANEERAAKNSGGLINSKINKSESRMVGSRKMTKDEYIGKMVKKYGKEKLNQIKQQWLEYSTGK